MEITQDTKISTYILEHIDEYRDQIEKVLCLPEYLTVTAYPDIESVGCPCCESENMKMIMAVQYKGRSKNVLKVTLSSFSYPVHENEAVINPIPDAKPDVHENTDIPAQRDPDKVSIPLPRDAYVCNAAFILPSGYEMQINRAPCTFGDIINKLAEYESCIIEYNEIDKRFRGDIYSMMKYIKALETQGAQVEKNVKETKDALENIENLAQNGYTMLKAVRHDAVIERTEEQTAILLNTITHVHNCLVRISNAASKTWQSLLPYSDLWE